MSNNFAIDSNGEYVLAGYEWISFSSLALALRWRRRNHRLRVACDLDARFPKEVL